MTRPSARHRARSARRLAPALAVSLLIHAWLAGEFSAGSGLQPPEPQPVLTVRIAPATPPDRRDVSLRAATGASGLPAPRPAPRPGEPHAAAPSAASPANAALLPQADPTYYPARQLDVYPALVSALEVAYPDRARAEGRAGRVLVLVMIDAAGRVDEVSVVEAEPPGYFEQAARQAFAAAQFSPARRNGLPVRSRVLISLDFDPRAALPAGH